MRGELPLKNDPEAPASQWHTAAGRFDCVETHGLRPCRRLRRRACGRAAPCRLFRREGAPIPCKPIEPLTNPWSAAYLLPDCRGLMWRFRQKPVVAFGGARFILGYNLHGSPPWRFFCPCKRNQNRVKGDRFPLDKPLSDALLRWIRKAFFLRKKPSVLHADGLKKSLRRIFIAAALGRRTANHHPCPLLRGGELWGRKANTF